MRMPLRAHNVGSRLSLTDDASADIAVCGICMTRAVAASTFARSVASTFVCIRFVTAYIVGIGIKSANFAAQGQHRRLSKPP